jgi:imidazolonepropionase-like amidohydrolase
VDEQCHLTLGRDVTGADTLGSRRLTGLVRRCCAAGVAVGSRVLGIRGSAPRVRGDDLGRGVALVGRIWTGRDVVAGLVVVGPDGRVAALGADRVPEGVRVLHGRWVGPGIVDAHVHLAFGGPAAELAGGLVGVRDLGAPPTARWRDHEVLAVAAVGPLLTARGGYPSTSWGSDGFAAFVSDDPAPMVRDLVADGVDLVKIALEPGDGLPVPTPGQVRRVVAAAHEAGLAVTCHALSVAMVERALDAGVDELAHTPVEPLPPALVDRIADAGIAVVSTLQCHAGIPGRGPMRNAAALVAAGVPLRYGTDLGNGGTRPGVDPRELDRLADAGLGREGALRAATAGSAASSGLGGRAGDGTIRVGAPARLVLLDADPLVEPAAWAAPLAVVTAGRVITP